MQKSDLVAAGILLASTTAFGALLGQIARTGGFRMDPVDLEAHRDAPLKEWLTLVVTFGLIGLSIDAFGRWVLHYVDTGEALSIEEITEEYE